MHEQPAPLAPICPLCEKPVEPGDHVVFGHGETPHLDCHFNSGGITESVARFLRHHVGAEYCQTCLARTMRCTYERVVKAVTALRMTSRYRVRAMGTCSGCGNHWMTIKAEAPAVDGG
jgi:hypothetical protein